MSARFLHPDVATLLECVALEPRPLAAGRHAWRCARCTQAVVDLEQIAAVVLEEEPPVEVTRGLREAALAALRLPRSTPAHGRASSAARAGSD